MNDKEKLLIGVIIMLFGAIITYRIGFVDSELTELEDRIRILETK